MQALQAARTRRFLAVERGFLQRPYRGLGPHRQIDRRENLNWRSQRAKALFGFFYSLKAGGLIGCLILVGQFCPLKGHVRPLSLYNVFGYGQGAKNALQAIFERITHIERGSET